MLSIVFKKILMAKQILKESILDAAEQLILQKGVNAASVNDICIAANATKGAFFHHFKSKENLIQESIVRFSQHIVDEFNKSGIIEINEPVLRLKSYFNFIEQLFITGKYDAGCLIGISAQEVAFNHPEYQAVIKEAFMPTLIRMSKLVGDAAVAQKITLDSESISKFWLASFQGSVLLSRGMGDRTIIFNSINNFKHYIFLLLNI